MNAIQVFTITSTQNQYDSLADFTFNNGPNEWLKNYCDLRNILLSGNVTYKAMFNEFMTWLNTNGKKSEDLYRRHMDELGIFLNNKYNREYLFMPDNV